jgi:hypothetical protein
MLAAIKGTSGRNALNLPTFAPNSIQPELHLGLTERFAGSFLKRGLVEEGPQRRAETARPGYGVNSSMWSWTHAEYPRAGCPVTRSTSSVARSGESTSVAQ